MDVCMYMDTHLVYKLERKNTDRKFMYAYMFSQGKNDFLSKNQPIIPKVDIRV